MSFYTRLILCFLTGILCCSALYSQPVASFTSNVKSGCSPLVVSFDASASTGTAPLTYIWNFGNGNKIQGPDAKRGAIYSNSGVYQVSLVVKDATGLLSNPVYADIEVFVNPSAAFVSPALTAGCAPFSASFQDQSVPGSAPIRNWTWDFGNGASSSATNPSQTYSTAGEYAIKLIVTDANGCRSVSRQPDKIRVYPTLKANFSAAPVGSCTNSLSTAFTDLSNYPSTTALTYTYSWNFGDGTSSTEQNPSKNYTGSGSYNVTYTVRDNTGTCGSTVTKPAYITIGNINPDFQYQPSGGCNSKNIQFTLTAPPVANYNVNWDFGDGTSSTAAQPAHNYAANGTYNVTLTVQHKTDASCVRTVTKPVVIAGGTSVLPVDFTTDTSASCKKDFTVRFTPNINNAAGYEWDFGDGTTSAAKTPAHTYTATGVYTVKLLITYDALATCRGETTKTGLIKIGVLNPFFTSDGKNILLKPKLYDNTGYPLSNIQGGCLDQPVHFRDSSISGSAIASYAWNFGDGSAVLNETTGNATHLYTVEGYYSPSLTVTTKDGCSATYTCDSCVKRGKKPDALLEKPGYPDMCCGYDALFNNMTDPATYDYVFYETGNFDTQGINKKNGVFEDVLGDADGYPDGDWHHMNLSTAMRPYYSVNGLAMYTYNLGCPDSVQYDAFQRDYLPWGTAGLTPPNCKVTIRPGGVLDFNDSNQVLVTTVWGLDGAIDSMRITFDVTGGKTKCGFKVDTTYSVRLDGVWVTDDTLSVNPLVLRPPYKTLRADSLRAQHKLPVVPIPACFEPDQSLPQGYIAAVATWDLTSPKRCACRLPSQNFFTPFFDLAYTLTVKDPSGCAPLKVHLQTEDSVRQVNWTFSNGLTSTNKQLDVQFDQPGTYTYQAALKYDCKDTVLTGTIQVTGAQPKLELSDSIPCFAKADSLQITLTDASQLSVGVKSKSWLFNGTEISNENLPAIVYKFRSSMVPAPYNQYKGLPLVLKITDLSGCVASDTAIIYLRKPVARFSVFTVPGCTDTLVFNLPPRDSLGIPERGTQRLKAHLYINVIDTLTGRERTLKTLDADFSSRLANRLAVPNGKYRVLMKVDWDGFGSGVACESAFKDTVLVVNARNLSVGFNTENKAYICAPANVKFFDTSQIAPGFPVTRWLWTFYNKKKDKISESSEPQPSNIYLDSGYYGVRLKVTDSRGCTSELFRDSVFRIGDIYGTFATPKDSLCAGDTITLSVAATNAQDFLWDMGDGNIRQGDTVQYVYRQEGDRRLNLLLMDRTGTCKKTIEGKLYTSPLPDPGAGPDTTVCIGTPVPLHAANGIQYAWTPAIDLNDSSLARPVANPTVTGWYRVTVANRLGCKGKDSVLVKIQDPVVIRISGRDTICIGGSTRLSATGNGAGYLWSPATGIDNPASASPVVAPTATTTYKVIGFSGGSCPDDSAFVTVTVGEPPVVDAGPDLVITGGQSIGINPTTGPNITAISWLPAKDLSCIDCYTPTFYGTNTTTYTVQVRSNMGCLASDQVTIRVLCDGSKIYAPSAFTPNDDQVNDTYRLVGPGNVLVKSFQIYNRLGEIVYQKKDYYANDKSGWDGRYKGLIQPGTYVFWAKVICPDGKENFFKGTVVMIK